MLRWCKSAVNLSFFLSLAILRMCSNACDTLTRLCVRHVLCWLAFPLVPALGSTGSAADCSALFAGFAAVESGEVEGTPWLCPLAQTAPAGFSPGAFPGGGHCGGEEGCVAGGEA